MIHLSQEEAVKHLYKSESWYRPLNLPANGRSETRAFSRLKPRRQLLALIALTGPENKDLPRLLPLRRSEQMWAIDALDWIARHTDPARAENLLRDKHVNSEVKAAIRSARNSGRFTGDLIPVFERGHNHESYLRIVQYGPVRQRVDLLKALDDSELSGLVSSADPGLLDEVIGWARHVERRKVYKPEGATLTVFCGAGDLQVDLMLSARQWRRVRAGERLAIDGDRDGHDDAELGHLYDTWQFNFDHPGSLKVTFDTGWDGFIGDIEDALEK
jgi:hypothetical protein